MLRTSFFNVVYYFDDSVVSKPSVSSIALISIETNQHLHTKLAFRYKADPNDGYVLSDRQM